MRKPHAKEWTICLMIPMITCILLAGCQEPNQHAVAVKPFNASTPSTSQVSPASQEKVSAYVPEMATRAIAACNLEAMGADAFGHQAMALNLKQQNAFTGWIDAGSLTRPSYLLRLDDQAAGRYLQLPIDLTIQRPDVASTHAGTSLVSGFVVTVPADGLPAGQYHVYLAVQAGGAIYVCDNGRHIHATH